MNRNYRLLCGPLASAIFGVFVAGLPLIIPGYSYIRQTVSEIGEIGSPARIPFAIMLCAVSVCLLIFASGVRKLSAAAGRSQWTTYLIAFMAIPAAGTGIFAFPHPLHNVFGISEVIGYQAPLAMALSWRRDRQARSLVTVSWIAIVLIWFFLAVNMSTIDRRIILWPYVKPVMGLAQRGLFAAWFSWSAAIGCILFQPKWGNRVFASAVAKSQAMTR
jgi:hypothetical membrane protein